MFAESSCDGGESNIRECRESIYSPTCANDNIGWVVCQSGKGDWQSFRYYYGMA